MCRAVSAAPAIDLVDLTDASESPRQSPHDVMRAHQGRSYGRCVTTIDPTTQPGADAPVGRTCVPHYEIRVSGHLGSRWAAWFDGLELTTEDDGTTVLRGPVVDQSALHGLLLKLRDIGIPLVSLTELPPGEPSELPHLSNVPLSTNPSGATS